MTDGSEAKAAIEALYSAIIAQKQLSLEEWQSLHRDMRDKTKAWIDQVDAAIADLES